MTEQNKLIHVGYTNQYQVGYAKDDQGAFYPDTDNDCYIPLYMLATHVHRLGVDAKEYDYIHKLESAILAIGKAGTYPEVNDALTHAESLVKNNTPATQNREEN